MDDDLVFVTTIDVHVVALDRKAGRVHWEATAAGKLVFSGTMEGDFFALNAVTGKQLWRKQTCEGNWAVSVSYRFERRQYVAVAAGGAMAVRGLDGR